MSFCCMLLFNKNIRNTLFRIIIHTFSTSAWVSLTVTMEVKHFVMHWLWFTVWSTNARNTHVWKQLNFSCYSTLFLVITVSDKWPNSMVAYFKWLALLLTPIFPKPSGFQHCEVLGLEMKCYQCKFESHYIKSRLRWVIEVIVNV